ncbi:MAG: NFACT RNA binding domain-containing protein [Melioribacteraceae bacterium]
MYRNYFYLLRSINDLIPDLLNSTITDIYSQEKDKLFLKIPNNNFPDRHLIISANPNSTFIVIKNSHFKAKKNVIQIFNSALFSKIENIEIAANERIVKFDLENSSIYFSIRGNKTNIFLLESNSQFYSFKKTNETNISYELEQKYFNGINIPSFDLDKNNITEVAELKKIFPMISNEIKNEIEFRTSIEKKSVYSIFQIFVQEILTSPIRIGFNQHLQKIIFIPNTIKSLNVEGDFRDFTNSNEALQYYFSTYFKLNSKNDITNELEKYFDNELSNSASKLNKLKIRIESGSNEELYYTYGNLLLSNLNLLRKGLSDIKLNSLEIEKEYKIKLDPKLNSKDNIDKYFEKAKDEKVNFNKSVELFKLTKDKYDNLQTEFENFKLAKTIDEITEIYNRIIPKKEKIVKMDSGEKFKYWLYKIDDKYSVYIGRDSKSNDYLSIKFANQNDYWFHARGLPGSHVVLRVDNLKEIMPKEIIKKAACLAAYYSKAKTAGSAPVSYTFAKFVHKKKGMEPGKVLLQKENSILVKPEIPKNCELINE